MLTIQDKRGYWSGVEGLPSTCEFISSIPGTPKNNQQKQNNNNKHLNDNKNMDKTHMQFNQRVLAKIVINKRMILINDLIVHTDYLYIYK